MILTREQTYNAIIMYLDNYNKRINGNEDIKKSIEMIKKLKESEIDKEYLVDEQDALIDMYYLLKDYYDETKLDEIGSLLGDIVLFENGTTADPAAWQDWISVVNKVINLSDNQS